MKTRRLTALSDLYFGRGHRVKQGETFDIEERDGARLLARGLARLPTFEVRVTFGSQVRNPDYSVAAEPPAMAVVRQSVEAAACKQVRKPTQEKLHERDHPII
jgi:hypothetical protein